MGAGGWEKRHAFSDCISPINNLAVVASASLSLVYVVKRVNRFKLFSLETIKWLTLLTTGGWVMGVGGREMLQAFRDRISPPNNLAVVACASFSSLYFSIVI